MSLVKKFPPIKEFRPHRRLPLQQGLVSRIIQSIYIAKDDHIFLSDLENQSIIELNEHKEILTECRFDENNFFFQPNDVELISLNILVACGLGKDPCGMLEGKIIFLERKKIRPHLKVKKIIRTEKHFLSLCSTNESIFCCDANFAIHSFTKVRRKNENYRS